MKLLVAMMTCSSRESLTRYVSHLLNVKLAHRNHTPWPLRKEIFELLMSVVCLVSSQHRMSWYEVRDTLLGQNCRQKDVKRALELANECQQHPDARWLTELCSRNHVSTAFQASQAFRNQPNDARALCFYAFATGDDQRMRQSASMGYAFAQACMSNRTRDDESREWARKAAAQGERDGYRRIGTQESLLSAIELGCVESMQAYALLLSESDPQRFFWLGKAALQGCSFRFREDFPAQVRLFRTDTVFAIGRALKGNVDFEANTLFGVQYGYHWALGSARVAIDFFETRLVATRSTVDAWTIVGTRLKNVKDVRRIIAELLWKAREE